MLTRCDCTYINPSLSQWNLDLFFQKIFEALQDEMNKVVSRYYGYPGKTPPEDDVFFIIERTWLGFFNNAIIRSFPQEVTLQEFMVWGEDNKAKGRCDFLFSWGAYDILVETKIYEFKNDWGKFNNKQFYEEKKMQKLRDLYFKEEEVYYPKATLGMVLVFEWIREKNRLEHAKELVNNWKINQDTETDFLALYYGINRGVIVYGKIEEFKKEKLV